MNPIAPFIIGGILMLEGILGHGFHFPYYTQSEQLLDKPSLLDRGRRESKDFIPFAANSVFGPRKSREIPVSMFRLKRRNENDMDHQNDMDDDRKLKRLELMRLKKNQVSLFRLRKKDSPANLSMLRLRKKAISPMRLRKKLSCLEGNDCPESTRSRMDMTYDY